jgi:hypothetical protein
MGSNWQLEPLKNPHMHPKCGASWEGAIIRELLRRFDVHSRADLDLLVVKGSASVARPRLSPLPQTYGAELDATRSPRLALLPVGGKA